MQHMLLTGRDDGFVVWLRGQDRQIIDHTIFTGRADLRERSALFFVVKSMIRVLLAKLIGDP